MAYESIFDLLDEDIVDEEEHQQIVDRFNAQCEKAAKWAETVQQESLVNKCKEHEEAATQQATSPATPDQVVAAIPQLLASVPSAEELLSLKGVCDHLIKVAVNSELSMCAVCRKYFTGKVTATIFVSNPKPHNFFGKSAPAPEVKTVIESTY